MNEVLNAIEKRSSTRGYTEEPLTEEELKALVTAGLQAPTAANRQEVHFSVVDGKSPILGEIDMEKRNIMAASKESEEEKRAIFENPMNFYYNAPTVIVISNDRSMAFGKIDAGIAAENIAIAAQGMGLGSLIIGIIKSAMDGEKKEHFDKALGIPENYEFAVALALGHKSVEKVPHTYDEAKSVTYVK